MLNVSKALIQKIVQTTGPSGFEQQVRALVAAEIQGHADEIKTDALGNLVARKGTPGQGKKIMVSAHMDEIGVIVTHVDKQGFARFTALGGVFPRNCVGARVRFLNGAAGVIGVESSSGAPGPLSEMYIDLGSSSDKTCPVKVGDVAAFEREFYDLGDRLVSKAMDDRIGVYVALEALRQLNETPNEVYFVFSTQEEVGLRGATTSAFGVNPDIGIAVDVTGTGDTPKADKMEVALGKGTAIKVRDAGMISDPRMVEWMVKTAQKEKIPYQLEILTFGTTDARAIQTTRAGVPSGCISIPCRYIHTPSEMVSTADVHASIQLLVALLRQPVRI